MTIASRTCEGLPGRCPLCGKRTQLEFSDPAGDPPCSHCACLLWFSQQRLSQLQEVLQEKLDAVATIGADTSLADLKAESLDVVEMVISLEDEFDLEIPDDDFDQLKTVGDVIRYMQNRLDDHKT